MHTPVVASIRAPVKSVFRSALAANFPSPGRLELELAEPRAEVDPLCKPRMVY